MKNYLILILLFITFSCNKTSEKSKVQLKSDLFIFKELKKYKFTEIEFYLRQIKGIDITDDSDSLIRDKAFIVRISEFKNCKIVSSNSFYLCAGRGDEKYNKNCKDVLYQNGKFYSAINEYLDTNLLMEMIKTTKYCNDIIIDDLQIDHFFIFEGRVNLDGDMCFNQYKEYYGICVIESDRAERYLNAFERMKITDKK